MAGSSGTKNQKMKQQDESTQTTSTSPIITTNDDDSSEPKLSRIRVALIGLMLVGIGMIGFYNIPGLISTDAKGNPFINAFYCSVMTLTTIGFGDICPGETDFVGNAFLSILPLFGLGFFCGPILSIASSWQDQVPGGVLSLATMTLALGVSMLTTLEGMTFYDAVHLSVITGTTIGYGNITPKSDMGRLSLALYAILVCNVVGGFLNIGREYLESFCKETPGLKTKKEGTLKTKAEKKKD